MPINNEQQGSAPIEELTELAVKQIKSQLSDDYAMLKQKTITEEFFLRCVDVRIRVGIADYGIALLKMITPN